MIWILNQNEYDLKDVFIDSRDDDEIEEEESLSMKRKRDNEEEQAQEQEEDDEIVEVQPKKRRGRKPRTGRPFKLSISSNWIPPIYHPPSGTTRDMGDGIIGTWYFEPRRIPMVYTPETRTLFLEKIGKNASANEYIGYLECTWESGKDKPIATVLLDSDGQIVHLSKQEAAKYATPHINLLTAGDKITQKEAWERVHRSKNWKLTKASHHVPMTPVAVYKEKCKGFTNGTSTPTPTSTISPAPVLAPPPPPPVAATKLSIEIPPPPPLKTQRGSKENRNPTPTVVQSQLINATAYQPNTNWESEVNDLHKSMVTGRQQMTQWMQEHIKAQVASGVIGGITRVDHMRSFLRSITSIMNSATDLNSYVALTSARTGKFATVALIPDIANLLLSHFNKLLVAAKTPKEDPDELATAFGIEF